MRVFFFITKSEQGGAQTHVAQMARWLVEHGHEVAVMSQPGGGTPSEASCPSKPWRSGMAKEGWLQEETLRLGGTFIPNDSIVNTICLCRLWKGARDFEKAVFAFNPDLVACHSTMAGLMGRLSLRGRIPTTFTAHGWGFTQGAPRLRQWILPIFERLAGRYAKKIICVSRNDLELARSRRIVPNDKLALVYNGVETFDNAEIASAVPRNDEKVHIYFVGRLAAPKNPFLLVKAFSRLPRELQEKTHITIIGDGPDRTRLEALIENLHLTAHVELTGALPRKDVLERLCSQADIFVLISHWEGFPYCVLEAMAASVPIIASHIGGIPEALEHGSGILIDGDSLEQLVQALTLLITDNALREKMGGMAKQTVESKFSVEDMCEKTFAQYKQALLQ